MFWLKFACTLKDIMYHNHCFKKKDEVLWWFFFFLLFFAAYCGSFEIAAHCTSLNDLIWMKQNIFVCFESDFFVCVYTSHSTFVLQEKNKNKTALILLYRR